MTNKHIELPALEKISKALLAVAKLCDGSQHWTMSVPARPDSDPDLVIADALRSAHAAIAAHEQARVVGEPVAWIATKDQMPPEGLRVFWMDEASNRVGYDTYAGEGYSWAASHWMRIPLIGVAPKNTDVDLVTELRRLLPVLEYYDTMRGLCNQLSEANKVRQVIYAQESTNE